MMLELIEDEHGNQGVRALNQVASAKRMKKPIGFGRV
jgi:hypothetical protein